MIFFVAHVHPIQPLKARLVVIPYNNLPISNRYCFAFAYAVSSRPSVTIVTQRLLSWLQQALNALLFVSQFHPVHPSSYVLHKIGLSLLKRQLSEYKYHFKVVPKLVILFLRQRRDTATTNCTNWTSHTMEPRLHNA